LKSIILSRKKSFEEARISCAAYTANFEKEVNKAVMGNPFRLQGEIELAMRNFERAIGLLTQAKSLFPSQQGWAESNTHAGFMDPLAQAYFRAGDLERARQEYEAITRLTTGRLNYGEIYARSFYMLGQVYEQLGKKKQARVNYRKFLDLWKNADQGLPEVGDAKKRLTSLS
jgi:tetratricopeptide (TPR) repeat protein